MAWSRTARDATDVGYLDADKPMFVAANWMRSGLTSKWTADGLNGSADITAAGAPTSCLADDATERTYPASSGTTRALNFYWSAGINIEALALVSFAGLSTATVKFDISDGATFPVGPTTITLATWTPGAHTNRLVAWKLDHLAGGGAFRYTGVTYARLLFTAAGPITPYLGELWVCPSIRQLKHQPTRPYDDGEHDSSFADRKGQNGRTMRYVHYARRRLLHARLNPSITAQQTALQSFWHSDIAGGARSFLWVPRPTSAPQDAPMMFVSEEALAFPWLGPAERELNLSAFEQAPDFVALEA